MKSQLEKIVEWLRSLFDSIDRARSATELARGGHHSAANELISSKN